MNNNKRNIYYFYEFKDANGVRHYAINKYDTILHWITFMNDQRFQPEDLKSW